MLPPTRVLHLWPYGRGCRAVPDGLRFCWARVSSTAFAGRMTLAPMAGDIAPAAAMGMMIFYTNVIARLIHLFITRKVMRTTQAWRTRQADSK